MKRMHSSRSVNAVFSRQSRGRAGLTAAGRSLGAALGIYGLVVAGAACGPDGNFDEPPAEVASLSQELIGPAPKLTGCSPSIGPADGSVKVTLTGRNFRPGLKVTVGTRESFFVESVTPTQIVFYLPNSGGVTGAVPITVTLPDGKNVARTDLFSYFNDTLEISPAYQALSDIAISAVTAADVNGDGKVDVIAAKSSTSAGTKVLLNRGDGSLREVSAATTIGYSETVKLQSADINGDGKADLMALSKSPSSCTSGCSSYIEVSLGRGDGTFIGHRLIESRNVDNGVLLGASLIDVNGDGKVDLVSGSYAKSVFGIITSYVDLYAGKGDGTFEAKKSTELGSGISKDGVLFDVIDVNNDGNPDLVYQQTRYDVAVRLGLGDGTFSATAKLSTLPSSAQELKLADVNGDRRLDLVYISYGGPTYAGVMLGMSDGSFGAITPMAVTSGADQLAVGDINGDGKVDALVGSFSDTSLLLGRGDGTFGGRQVIGKRFSGKLQLVELTGDGRPDLLQSSRYGLGLDVLPNNGRGGFYETRALPVGTLPAGGTIGDINADGKVDLVVISSDAGAASVYLGNKDGTLGYSQSIVTEKSPSAAVLADINADGKVDLLVSNFDAGTVSVLLGNGDGTFNDRQNFAAGVGPSGLVVLDLNGDGKLDVATSNFDGNNLSVMYGTGTGTLQAPKNYSPDKGPSAIAAADVNGDTKPDLIVTNAESGTVTVHLATMTGFATAKSYTVGKYPAALVLGDVNADGKVDIAVANAESNTVSVLTGKGDGTFAAGAVVSTCAYPSAIFLSDLDKARGSDLAVSCDGDQQMNFLMGFGDGNFYPAKRKVTRPASGPTIAGDLNGDGRLDFVVTSETEGTAAVLMNRTL